MSVEIRRVNNYTYDLIVNGETLTVSPDILKGLDIESLIGLKFVLTQELGFLGYEIRKYENEKKSLKVDIMNSLRRENSKMSKTEAESQVEVDARYKGVLEVINSLKLQNDLLIGVISMVKEFIELKKAREFSNEQQEG